MPRPRSERRRPEPVERMLRNLERRVLDDVWLDRLRSTAIGVLAPVLAVTATVWWIDLFVDPPAGMSLIVPTVVLIILALAAGTSLIARATRRFRWCCAAAYLCGLGTVVGLGGFWWVRTGATGPTLSWLVGAADVAVLCLAVAWLTLLAAPVQRTHPDMRG